MNGHRIRLRTQNLDFCRAARVDFFLSAFRLLMRTGADRALWALRSLMPRSPTCRNAEFDTLRLRLVKLAMRVVGLETCVTLHLPAAYPDQAILRLVRDRLQRLAC